VPVAVSPGQRTNPAAPDEVIGRLQIVTARHEDTLLDLAVNNGLGFIEIAAANQGVDAWLPGAGTRVVMPQARFLPDSPRNGLVINLPAQRVFLFKNGALIAQYPVGVFRDGFTTPTGTTTIARKAVNPTWYPTPSTRADNPDLPAAVPPGPDNPLGTRALYLGWARYLIHGTNTPYGIGRRVSRGCLRMYNPDVEALYDKAPVGTPVHVVNQPVQVGWWQGELFVQAYPTLEQAENLAWNYKLEPIEVPDIRDKVQAKAGAYADRVDWPTVEKALRERRGIPIQITNTQTPVFADLPQIAARPPQPAGAQTAAVQ
jgi:L,D-transpeptidase ErfK/SrfK